MSEELSRIALQRLQELAHRLDAVVETRTVLQRSPRSDEMQRFSTFIGRGEPCAA